MNIFWQYLDKRNAAIGALKDFSSMQAIIDNTKNKIEMVQIRMMGVGSAALSDVPKGQPDPTSGENRIINGIEEIDILRERYRQALEYMEWFQPAWDSLNEDEKTVLELFYQTDDYKRIDAVSEICNRFCIERSTAYKKKDQALSHLAVLLFGK